MLSKRQFMIAGAVHVTNLTPGSGVPTLLRDVRGGLPGAIEDGGFEYESEKWGDFLRWLDTWNPDQRWGAVQVESSRPTA